MKAKIVSLTRHLHTETPRMLPMDISSWSTFSFIEFYFLSFSFYILYILSFFFIAGNLLEYRRAEGGTSLEAQWSRLCASNAGSMDSVHGWATKIPHTTWHSQKKSWSYVSQFWYNQLEYCFKETIWRKSYRKKEQHLFLRPPPSFIPRFPSWNKRTQEL